MRRALAALSLLCGLSVAAVAPVRAQSPVWALHGAHNTVFLAESVHLLRSGDASLPPAFDRAYAASQTIVMELDLARLDTATMQSWMLAHGMLPAGTTLREAVGDGIYGRASAESDRLGIPIEALQRFEPWVVALTLADLEYQKLGYDPDQGVERQIERRADRDGKPIRGLETLDQQLGQLEHLSPAQQSRFLDLTVEEMHDAERDTDDLLAAWRAGDTRKLAALLSSDYDAFPELYRALVTDRNERWMPEIDSFLKDDHDYLVIVGALHLVGPGGLLELARREGLDPTPVIDTR
ncbi:MAG: TraB/GumN family protein [Steroidobacteraceae bacterium]